MSYNKNKSSFLDRDVLLKFFEENPNYGILSVLSYLINGFLLSEREIFLSESRDIPNKANGFSSRNIFTPLGKLHIDVPRDRKSLFYSDLLPPPYHRTYPDDYFHLLLSLINNSYSPNGIKNVLHLLNLPYSPESIDKIKDDLFKKATELNESPIKEDMFAIFIDAYHCKMRDDFSQGTSGKIKESVIYVVIGIDLDGNKDLIGYYVRFGNENKGDWLSIFNQLVSRGLKRPMIIVSDDFSGLTEAIKEIFPSSDIQLCYVHLKRNIRRNMAKEDSKTMISELNKLKYENDYDVAVERFEKMCKVYEKKYPYFIKRLLKNSRYYFQFLKYPEEVRKHIYTTNIVESFNSMIEVLRINNGGFFGSRKSVEVSIYLIRDKLQSKQWKKGIVHIKGAHYEIQQMFNLKFNSIQTQNS